MATPQTRAKTSQSFTTGYETHLWQMADALRGSMDAAEYKHVVLGLIFLKYISDAFEERHAEVLAEWGEEAAENIFWVHPETRWPKLQSQAQRLDAAIETNLERLGSGYNEPV